MARRVVRTKRVNSLNKDFPSTISEPILEEIQTLAKRSLNNRSQWT